MTIETKLKIEPRIKPLVEILNRVDYITTNSSCQGHPERWNNFNGSNVNYDSYNPNNANVAFNVQNEKEFERLAAKIMAKTVNLWPDTHTDIYKRYWVLPEEKELNHVWSIEFKPFDRSKPDYKIIKDTDLAIKESVEVICEYLKRRK